jgi:hypothetical protein
MIIVFLGHLGLLMFIGFYFYALLKGGHGFSGVPMVFVLYAFGLGVFVVESSTYLKAQRLKN